MRLNIKSIITFLVILLIPATLFAVKDYSFNPNSALAYTLTPPITPPYSPTPTPTATPTPTVAPTPTPTPTLTSTPTPTATPAPIKTITLNIAQGADDAWQTADVNKTVNTNSTSIKLGWYAGVSGFRFAGNLSDLKNKTVLKANLSLTSTNNTNSPISLKIFAQNSAKCSTFNTTQNNIGLRPISQNSVAWTPTSWEMNTSYNSPNLKSLISEVTSRSDFEGNSLCLLIQNNGSANYSERLVRAKESSLPSAKLTITYQ